MKYSRYWILLAGELSARRYSVESRARLSKVAAEWIGRIDVCSHSRGFARGSAGAGLLGASPPHGAAARAATAVVDRHLILFIARLSFITPAGLLVIFFLRYDELRVSPLDTALLFGILFALFCFTTELKRLGRRLTATE
ncbi:hypothetical protein [Rhodanobacter lindaniclasticus]